MTGFSRFIFLAALRLYADIRQHTKPCLCVLSPSRSLCAFLVVLGVFFQIPSNFTLANTQTGNAENLNNSKLTNTLSGYRSKVNRIQQSIADQKIMISEGKGDELNLLVELEKLDKKLITQQEKLDSLEVSVLKQQLLIEEEQEKLDALLLKRKKVESHLQKRITAYYKMGDIGMLNITFSTKSLPELLSFHDAFDNLIKYDQSVIANYKKTIEEQKRLKDAFEREKTILEEFRKESETENQGLLDTKIEKKQLLAQIRTKAKLHQQAVEELQAASDSLVESIVSLKNKNQLVEKGFLNNKGSLPPPVDGTIITLFQEEKKNKFGILKPSQGIELKAPDGTKIVAVSGGQVIYSGYLRGYGNTIIIHHGYQYYTVTSRIEKLLIKKGARVERETTIGVVGDTATLFDEGLYFEIRHNKESLDPLLWLNPNRLTSRSE